MASEVTGRWNRHMISGLQAFISFEGVPISVLTVSLTQPETTFSASKSDHFEGVPFVTVDPLIDILPTCFLNFSVPEAQFD